MENRFQQLLHKLEHLPPEKITEVEDFIDFLSQKDREHQMRKDFARGAEASFHKVWDNEEDADYDKL